MEIGSIFDLDIQELFRENKKDFEFPFEKYYKYREKKFFNTGRSAIEFLFKYQLNLNENDIVLVPNFICSSVIGAIERANVKYEFYNVSGDFQIDIKNLLSKINDNVKAIFYINYFGFIQSKDVIYTLKELKKQYTIIEDNTQALFSDSMCNMGIGHYVIASIRKWIPIPDGAILYAQKELNEIKIEKGYNEYAYKYILAQLMKNIYLKNEKLDKEKYLELVRESTQSLFSDYTIREITRNILQSDF